MSLHKPIRYNDEYQCARCGKSWEVGEEEPPCVEPNDKTKQAMKELNNGKAIRYSNLEEMYKDLES